MKKSLQSFAEHDTTQWLDTSVRQQIVELALAGAQHGMETQARVILRALPALVAQQEARLCLHAALLIALGDTSAARDCLADLATRGRADDPTANVLRHWLDATDASQSRRRVIASRASLSSPLSPLPSPSPSRSPSHSPSDSPSDSPPPSSAELETETLAAVSSSIPSL
jgi:type III secretion system SsaH family protein